MRSKLRIGTALALLACLCLSLAACSGEGNTVYVQNVAQLSSGSVTPADRFPGMVVSENVTEIERDTSIEIAEVFVKAGDDVTAGQELFHYDTNQLQLNLDKQRLELEQLEATIENYKEQIEDLKNDRYNAPSSEQLDYTVQIQTMEINLKEAELNLAAKQTEVAQSESVLEQAVVVSPVDGRVQSINENGTDNYGRPLPYITIQQAGSYRIQATLGELQRGGILEGTRMKIISRTDSQQTWMGTVTSIDYENPSQGNSNNMYISSTMDPMSAASRYPFYVELDDPTGLMLGQHVYLSVDSGEADAAQVQLSSSFIAYDESGAAYVWVENNGRLTKRTVTLGEMNPATGAVAILEGLSSTDYIAFPDETLCREGAATTHQEPAEAETPIDNGGVMEVG
ncbi:MAG TPA: efflux RND transporter periplasmic adaptor subunit [Candidatus Faecousia intestinigallinarum]|nr:efflux RND transporter periplasmic adaptor subunit [Candidatus Faecousia intestinigallinarum]